MFYSIGWLDVGIRGLGGYMFLFSRQGKKYLYIKESYPISVSPLEPRVCTMRYEQEFKFIYSVRPAQRLHSFSTGIRYEYVTT